MFRLNFSIKVVLLNTIRVITLVLITSVFYSCMGNPEENSDITISEQAMEFADIHFISFKYNEYEFQIAISANDGKDIYYGTINEWQALEWQVKQQYLPDCFTQQLPLEGDYVYYEMIGTLQDQYGYGWDDETHESGSNCWNGDSENLDTYKTMIGL